MAIALSTSHHSITRAIASSALASLPPDLLARLRSGAMRVDLSAGTVLERGCEDRFLGLVVDGHVRFYLASPEGRQVTFRHARAGHLVGVPTIIGVPRVLSSAMQATSDATLLVFDADLVADLATREPALAMVFARELTDVLWETMSILDEVAFGSIRQRVARLLIDLADHRPGRPSVVRRSHQEIADAIGSVREVVTRVLAQMRDEGSVSTGPGGVTIVDHAALLQVVRRRDTSAT